jgi:hypothetical protein
MATALESGGSVIYRHVVIFDMPCAITCDSCSLDSHFEDCTTAHRRAMEHEAAHATHYVSLRELA